MAELHRAANERIRKRSNGIREQLAAMAGNYYQEIRQSFAGIKMVNTIIRIYDYID